MRLAELDHAVGGQAEEVGRRRRRRGQSEEYLLLPARQGDWRAVTKRLRPMKYEVRIGMRSLSKDQARRIGAELKSWSQRPIGAANVRALALCGVLAVLMLVGVQDLPRPAVAVRGFAAMSAVMLATAHFIASGALRGLLRAGIAEAQDALSVLRDPRRISAFDMAMGWLLVGGLARYWE